MIQCGGDHRGRLAHFARKARGEFGDGVRGADGGLLSATKQLRAGFANISAQRFGQGAQRLGGARAGLFGSALQRGNGTLHFGADLARQGAERPYGARSAGGNRRQEVFAAARDERDEAGRLLLEDLQRALARCRNLVGDFLAARAKMGDEFMLVVGDARIKADDGPAEVFIQFARVALDAIR